MSLNIDEIYDNVESYRNVNNFSQDKMAEILGLANKQAYQKMMKSKSMKLIYIINLVNKTNLPIDHFLHESTKSPHKYKIEDKMRVAEDGCAMCIEKDKRILLLEKHIELLEFSLGKYRKNGSE